MAMSCFLKVMPHPLPSCLISMRWKEGMMVSYAPHLADRRRWRAQLCDLRMCTRVFTSGVWKPLATQILGLSYPVWLIPVSFQRLEKSSEPPKIWPSQSRQFSWHNEEDGGFTGHGNPLQYSGLENPMDCTVHGVAKSQTQLNDFHFTSLYLPLSLLSWVC